MLVAESVRWAQEKLVLSPRLARSGICKGPLAIRVIR